MALQTITKDILTRTDGAALLNLPYDFCFIAGYDKEMATEDVEARVYGEAIMSRPGTFIGEVGHSTTAPVGSALVLDIEKNGVTIYASTKPQFAAGSTTLTTNGVITTTTFISGDRITFRINSIGSSTIGKGVRFNLMCKV